MKVCRVFDENSGFAFVDITVIVQKGGRPFNKNK